MTLLRQGNRSIFVQSSAARERQRRNSVAMLVFVVTIFALITMRVLFPAEGGYLTALWKAGDYVSASLTPLFSAAAERNITNDEMNKLLAQLSAAESENEYLATRLREVENIEEIFGGTSSSTSHILDSHVARVLSSVSASPFDRFVINKGTKDGVSLGDFVFADSKLLLGKISKVDDEVAEVVAFSSPGEKNLVTVAGVDGSVEAEGRGGGVFMITVPHGISVATDTPVYLANRELLVAVTGEEPAKLRGDASNILARTPINLRAIKWVKVRSAE